MAVKRKNKRNGSADKPAPGSYFVFSVEKKKKIAGIFLIVISLLITLSIISYSRFDEARINNFFSDLAAIFNSPNGITVYNWLGVAGAHISNFFIGSTFGYFSIIFPVIMFMWGIYFFGKIKFRSLIHFSNFFILIGLILSSFFGVLRIHYGTFISNNEISGFIGDYTGEVLSRLTGGIGAIILLVASLIVLLIIAFDVKIEKVFTGIKNLFTKSVTSFKDEYSKDDDEADETINIKKAKEFREEKKRKLKKDSP
jgi:DNA segregation ATPase FtsK/SpoIIIE, S-DNA-T family